MKPARLRRAGAAALALCLGALALGQPAAPTQPAERPKLRAVAETALLMDALLRPNYRGVNVILKNPPAEGEAWAFGRGQALLLAESANLLMLRPPRSGQGADAWLARAADLRDSATKLARLMAARDYDRSRFAVVEVANSCNRCHRAFRVNLQVMPFEAE